jgi:hypothetical protein
MNARSVTGVETLQPITYSFKTLTYRKFQSVIEMLEDARSADRKERNRMNEEAASLLIDNAKQLLDEASNADVQRIMVEAIEFNQGTEADAKKSE